MTNQEILDAPAYFQDVGSRTLRAYFHLLLETLWHEGEGFCGKRPFGNSGWEYDVYKVLVAIGAIKGRITTEDGYTELASFDKAAAHKLVPQLIQEMCKV